MRFTLIYLRRCVAKMILSAGFGLIWVWGFDFFCQKLHKTNIFGYSKSHQTVLLALPVACSFFLHGGLGIYNLCGL